MWHTISLFQNRLPHFYPFPVNRANLIIICTRFQAIVRHDREKHEKQLKCGLAASKVACVDVASSANGQASEAKKEANLSDVRRSRDDQVSQTVIVH